MLIVFITKDTALCMLEHISHVQNSIVQIGNSQCLFKFRDVVRLVYKGANYTATLWFTLIQGA